MARKKRHRKRSRNKTMEAAQSPTKPDGAAWSDLEQAFFESAPPDDPEPPGEALRFDDLDSAAHPERGLQRIVRLLGAILRRQAVEPQLPS
jgi:hypothetical protein